MGAAGGAATDAYAAPPPPVVAQATPVPDDWGFSWEDNKDGQETGAAALAKEEATSGGDVIAPAAAKDSTSGKSKIKVAKFADMKSRYVSCVWCCGCVRLVVDMRVL